MKLISGLAVIVLFAASCSVGNKSFSDANKWIPPHFDINKGVLLIETFPGKEKWNREMDDFLSKKYPGKYLIVSFKETEEHSGKYSDVSKYPYILYWEVGARYQVRSGFTDYDPYGHFIDRTDGKKYPTTKKYNNYGNKSYIPFFNSIIKYSASKSTALNSR